MASPRSRLYLLLAGLLLLAGALAVGYLVWNRHHLPQPGSPEYEAYADAFQVGTAALDADVQHFADQNLTRAIKLVPQEPAAWANRGLLHIRHNQLEEASRDLAEAHRLAPDHVGIWKLQGLLEQRRGKFKEAIEILRRAAASDRQDIQTLYLLAQTIDQEQEADSDAEYQRLMEQILAVMPNNLPVLVSRLRVAVRRSDKAAVQDTLTRFKRFYPGWRNQTQTVFTNLETELGKQLGLGTIISVLQFDNVLKAEPDYVRGSFLVNPGDLAGKSIQTLIHLERLQHTPAAPDTELAFTSEDLPVSSPGPWDVVLPAWLTREKEVSVFVANAKELRRCGAEKALTSQPISDAGVLALDWNNDYRTDFLLAGPQGLIFYQQQANGSFEDVTSRTGLPQGVLKGNYYGAWAADTDADKDLDIILARTSGPPLLLRNNLDGTFTPLPIFTTVKDARAFAWVDLDNDGAPDAVLLDAAGRLHVFANERSGYFGPWPVTPPSERFLAIAIMDANADGVLDLVALRDDGAVVRISDQDKRHSWDVAELFRWDVVARNSAPGSHRLICADLDNNGAIDILVSGPKSSEVWLGTVEGKFLPLDAKLPGRLHAAVDLDGDGRLDLLGLSADGNPVQLRNSGKKNYHWHDFRVVAAPYDQAKEADLINSFGIGGEIELRVGTYIVKQPILAPVVHFGLGNYSRIGALRGKWTNGQIQVEFEDASHNPFRVDELIVQEQRYHTSCPYLFTWNGQGFEFVTDFMWSSPLGVPGSEQEADGFDVQTADWTRIRGDQLIPRDGTYEIRTLANLWETHYYDQLSLVAVDHPADTELFVDERASLKAGELGFRLLDKPRPVARAWDHHGQDITAIVAAVDGVHLQRAGHGEYSGITGDHWVEVDLGDDAPREGPVWLVATGWVDPVTTSTYFAIAQGKHEQPREPSLEVPDGKGGWKVAKENVGYPAGKKKTILVRLDGVAGPGVPRRFRLRTNLEVYWDALMVARGREGVSSQQHPLQPHYADLHFHGVVDMVRTHDSAPYVPNYERVVHRGQPWRNMIGYHTRYGNVRELLEKADDRYVILGAGDEMTLRFPVPAGPPAGWKRDFIWKCDGWTKDGDFNTRFSKTVLPLPAHDMKSYNTPPGRLQDDPVYRRHPRDWEIYHTRYVTPHAFEQGLRSFHPPGTENSERTP